ncbi:MAG: metal ABC transporter permease [Candidatus Omnitrophota bacterium]|jgi:zinc transport system permease protein|nr:MAG: metal ABC transporter permease [Candidatus Omnitrophota bacterium]
MEFLEALRTQSFMQHALIMGLLASLACGIMGTYVIVKRIVFISGGIAHAILGGMGIAYFLGYHPLGGAILCAIASALLIGIISLRTRQNEDTIIGALWAVGMAVGLIFISRTPGYNTDLMSYLFGNILLVSRNDLFIIGGLDVGILALVFLFYKQFLAICFDEEQAQLQGVRVEAVYLLLLCLIALTVVVLIQVVGIILVIALLTLPAGIASHYARSLGQMMLFATLLGMAFTTGGMYLSYEPDLPTGATIVILAGAFYLFSTIFKEWKIRRSRSAAS